MWLWKIYQVYFIIIIILTLWSKETHSMRGGKGIWPLVGGEGWSLGWEAGWRDCLESILFLASRLTKEVAVCLFLQSSSINPLNNPTQAVTLPSSGEGADLHRDSPLHTPHSHQICDQPKPGADSLAPALALWEEEAGRSKRVTSWLR